MHDSGGPGGPGGPVDDGAARQLAALMTSYQAGSLAAFEALYAALASPLLAYLAALCRDRGWAQDLLQDTFLQIHRSRRAYRPDLPVRPWVFTIARHVWLMDRRYRNRRPRSEGELPDVPVPAAVESLADRDRLRRALDDVLPDRREALLLHHVWGFSFAEIGQMLGIRADAAKLRSSRGITDLRQLLVSTRRNEVNGDAPGPLRASPFAPFLGEPVTSVPSAALTSSHHSHS